MEKIIQLFILIPLLGFIITLFIHRFSHATMPLKNLFKNSAHYCILSGFLIAHSLYSPTYQPPKSILTIIFGLFLFFAGELSNLNTHITLRNLRPSGSLDRKIPQGYGFNRVSCPNYLFEFLAWIGFSLMTGLTTSWIFTVVAGAQMWLWAVKKHKRYLIEFPNYPKNRKPMIPFLCWFN